MLVRNPSTGMPGQRVHVYIELLAPATRCAVPGRPDLDLGEGSANSQAPITERGDRSSTGLQRHKPSRPTVSRNRGRRCETDHSNKRPGGK